VAVLRTRNPVPLTLKLPYLLALVAFLAWLLRGYPQVTQKYERLWRGELQLDPLRVPLHNPLILLEGKVESGQLVLRLLRTYAAPYAEDRLIVVELHPLRGETVRMKVRKRVALGTFVTLAFPLSFSAEQLAGYRVEVYLNERLVAARQGDREWVPG